MGSNQILTIDGKVVTNGSGGICYRPPSDTTPPIAVLSNLPSNPTSATTVDITVGGADVVAYKYKLDGGNWSTETPIATHIQASGLSESLHTLSVVGKDSAGNWKPENEATTYTWTISLVVASGLMLHLDAGKTTSYPGTGSTWTDLSGRNHNGSIAAGVVYSTNNGGFFRFEGASNDYITVPNHADFKTGTATFELCIYRRANTGDILAFGPGSGLGQWYLRGASGFNICMAAAGYPTYVGYTANTTQLPLNAWQHITVICNQGASRGALYKNGTLVTTFGAQANTNYSSWYTGALYIGGYSWDGYSNSDIAIVRMYNRELSLEEVQQNFNATKTRFGL